jgi:hypothetical protein
VTRRSQVDDPPSSANQRRDPVDQDKVAQMIRAELCVEAIRGMPKRCGHHPRICDDDVETFTRRQECVGAGAHACKTRKIQWNKFKASILGRSFLLNLGRRSFRLCQIASRTHYLSAMRGE